MRTIDFILLERDSFEEPTRESGVFGQAMSAHGKYVLCEGEQSRVMHAPRGRPLNLFAGPFFSSNDVPP